MSTASIRQTRTSDSPALSRICLLTAAAGASAETLHAFPDLPGLIYALPYNKLETTFGFVLIDEEDPTLEQDLHRDTRESVVGYILGTSDTKKYEEIAEIQWWPAVRDKYPETDDPLRKPADKHYISVIHSPHKAPDEIASRFPAHIHINILPSHQRKSYGKALMAAAVNYLRQQGQTGIHVGVDRSNESAKMFYSRLGFERMDKEGGMWGLDFDNFKG